MANLEVAVPHNLSQEEALSRIKNMFTQMKQEHGDKISNLKEEWNGNVGNFSFTAQGFDVAGTLTVNPTNVEFNGKIPFTLSLFKGAITKTIEQQATKILS
jgi:putative polyhydroxyalkanoic acid system protein